jgi:hypothetical protein
MEKMLGRNNNTKDKSSLIGGNSNTTKDFGGLMGTGKFNTNRDFGKMLGRDKDFSKDNKDIMGFERKRDEMADKIGGIVRRKK